jgi:hypothetical protein
VFRPHREQPVIILLTQFTLGPVNPAGQRSPVVIGWPRSRHPSSTLPVHPWAPDALPPTVVVKMMVMDDDVDETLTPLPLMAASNAPGDELTPSKTWRVSPEATPKVEMEN